MSALFRCPSTRQMRRAVQQGKGTGFETTPAAGRAYFGEPKSKPKKKPPEPEGQDGSQSA